MPRRLVLGVALLAGALARPAAAAPCELQGSPHRAQLCIPVRGRAPIDLELNNTAVRARFTGPRASVEALGPFRIVGTALELPLALARPITAAGGAVHISTEMEIVRARPHRSQLRLAVDLAPRTSGFGYGAWKTPAPPRCIRSRQAMPAGGFAGKARLRAGATLHAEPGRGAWAEAREDVEVEVEIRDLAGDAWVRVVVAPGIAEVGACGQLDRAWVARADVTLP